MSELTPILNSFNGGEISPRMHGRTDQAIYRIAAAEMFNFVPSIEGPAVKRTGFRHIRAAMAASSYLSSFIFSVTQAYVIEWGEQLLRFYTNGGRIELGGGAPYEVAVPYTAAQAPFVSQQQSYDRTYLAHRSHKPAALTRTGASTFSFANLSFKDGPFGDVNTDETRRVNVTGGTGVVTVSCNQPIFNAGHIGSPFLIEAEDFNDIKAWEPGLKVIAAMGAIRRSGGRVYQCTAFADSGTTGFTGSDPPDHDYGSEWDGNGGDAPGDPDALYGCKWKYLYDRFGIGTITAVAGNGLSATMTVTRRIASSVVAGGSFKWAHAAFSQAAGWPSNVLLAFGRLIFFTDFEIIASVVGDYAGGTVNMAPFTRGGLFTPDMAFRRRLAISNPILWAREDRDVILIGTSDGTYAIRKINSGEIFASDNIECVKQARYRCAPAWPEQTGVSTIFVQRGGRKLREAGYSLDSDRYVSPDLTVWQRHIMKSGVKQLAFQADPEELLWAVRNDGQLALHPHVPEQEVRGFSRAGHAGGAVLSAVSIPSETAGDELWALVDGVGGKSVELQAPGWIEEETALEDAFYVDSGATYDGAPTTTITGITHLANRQVAVLADGAVVRGLSVSAGGELELPTPASKVHVGLGYQARLTWLRPDLSDGAGNTLQGKRKRIVSIICRVLETLGIKFDPGNGRAFDLINRTGGSAMDAPVPPLTGDTTPATAGGSWDREGQGTIISDDPLPCMVVAAMPKIEVGS